MISTTQRLPTQKTATQTATLMTMSYPTNAPVNEGLIQNTHDDSSPHFSTTVIIVIFTSQAFVLVLFVLLAYLILRMRSTVREIGHGGKISWNKPAARPGPFEAGSDQTDWHDDVSELSIPLNNHTSSLSPETASRSISCSRYPRRSNDLQGRHVNNTYENQEGQSRTDVTNPYISLVAGAVRKMVPSHTRNNDKRATQISYSSESTCPKALMISEECNHERPVNIVRSHRRRNTGHVSRSNDNRLSSGTETLNSAEPQLARESI